MFALAIIIGIYSYIILSVGILGLLTKFNIVSISLLYALLLVFFYKQSVFDKKRCKKLYMEVVAFLSNKFNLALIVILFIQALVNLVGALGPELSFDGLWYHLTLPKIFLLDHQIRHIDGGLFYYSDMPKLMEMLYIAALAMYSEILAKIIQFSFGILILFVIYKLSRNFFDKNVSLLAAVVFYSSLVVGWESTTAYVDLGRTFFEAMAFWGFINWTKQNEKKWLVESGVMLGLAICVKLLAIGSLIIFGTLFLYEGVSRKKGVLEIFANIITFSLTTLVISLPWFVISYLNTGNPIYPFFTHYYAVSSDWNLLNPWNFISEAWKLFTHAADPLSPIFIIFLPLLFFRNKRMPYNFKYLVIYSILATVVWYVIPKTGGGRFILPYLPVMSILSVSVLLNNYRIWFKYFLISTIIFALIVSIIFRGAANFKYLPTIIGKESRSVFLKKHLNFAFGDFYDTDGFFAKNIKSSDVVLLYGMHNLYYVDFPFIDSSYVKPGDRFNYILVQRGNVVTRFKNWGLIYENKTTHVRLYSKGGRMWIY